MCPGWDSNPHWTEFESAPSTGWGTGARAKTSGQPQGNLYHARVSRARVVVVEDESIIRLDLIEMLDALGYDVVGEAGDGRSALQVIAEQSPDLVLMDISMPDMDGLTALEAIRHPYGPAVVMVTAFGQDAMVQRAVAAGAAGYVRKPFSSGDLAPALEIALARHNQLRDMSTKAESAQDRLAARILIDRAKGQLQAIYGLSEDEAFALLRKQAMDERATMAQVAQRVLDQADL
jgi:two-component system, response regulator PdtaR